MHSSDLQRLAERARSMREFGMALLAASGLLALFLFVPLSSGGEPSAPDPSVAAVPDAFAQIPVEAKAAIVYDLATGTALYEKNADAQLPLASLTKLLTVYAALSSLSENASITVSERATSLEGPRAFSEGQAFTLGDIARLTLTASLNDGAAAIAEAAAARQGISENALFAGAVSALGLSQTYAVNGSGLDVNTEISGGYGSARDLARLAGALVELAPDIAAATARPSTHAVSEGGTSFEVQNTDPMVETLSRLLLSKTGYTDLAGGNLALVFDAGIRHPIAVVVLGSSQKARFTDGAALVAGALAHFAGVASL